MKDITPEMEYLSTRQSAKVLQVSLGTVQKMVELGELVAWKTRGGHRRILATSLEQQLLRRKKAMRQKCTQNCVAMGIFKNIENSFQLIDSIQSWQLKVEMDVTEDRLEGLMKAVSLSPDLIFLDTHIPPIEQVHLLNYLNKNKDTKRIPILVGEEFAKLHPDICRLKNLEIAQSSSESIPAAPENKLLSQNQIIISYHSGNSEGDLSQTSKAYPESLEPLFLQALSRKLP